MRRLDCIVLRTKIPFHNEPCQENISDGKVLMAAFLDLIRRHRLLSLILFFVTKKINRNTCRDMNQEWKVVVSVSAVRRNVNTTN